MIEVVKSKIINKMINELVVKKVKLLKMIDCHNNEVTALSKNVNVNKNCQ